jgi:hypothetical protein
MMGSGDDIQRNGCLIITNQRVVFFRSGFFGEVFQTMPFDKIGSIETRALLGYRVITMHASHDSLSFKTFEDSDLFSKAHRMIEDFRARRAANPNDLLSASPPPAPVGAAANLDWTDALLKLGDLRERGLLTEEEFAAKKAQLLAGNWGQRRPAE